LIATRIAIISSKLKPIFYHPLHSNPLPAGEREEPA